MKVFDEAVVRLCEAREYPPVAISENIFFWPAS